jgi:hypothetical protein
MVQSLRVWVPVRYAMFGRRFPTMPLMRASLLASVVLLAACGTGTDDAAVTTAPPVSVVDVSTTSTSPIETTTTTGATTTTVATTTTTTVVGLIDVGVVEGEVSIEGPIAVALGDEVTIRVTADVADEVHVHTYDLVTDLEPGIPSEITFVAEIPGIHEVELESTGLLLLKLEVGG